MSKTYELTRDEVRDIISEVICDLDEIPHIPDDVFDNAFDRWCAVNGKEDGNEQA